MRGMFTALTSGTAALCLLLAACGSDDVANPPAAGAAASTDEAGAADFNDADVIFAQGMIPHHEQAIEMADLALDPASGTGPEVLDLATRIKAAQDPEIELMTGWLASWGQPLEVHSSDEHEGHGEHDGHDMSTMAGMMSADEMEALAAATGTDFDRLWMEMMIVHHEGAVTQAETVLAEGSNDDVLTLAQQIIAAQQQEIDEMHGLLGAAQ